MAMYLHQVIVFIGTLAFARSSTTVVKKDKTAYILTLLPYPSQTFNPTWSDGPQISLALEIAKEEINNQTEILPNYQLKLIHGDGGCEFTTNAYRAIVRNAYSYGAPNVVGVIGPGCSSSSIAITALSSREELSLVTVHGGGSPLLADRVTRPYALGTLGSTESFAYLVAELIRKNNWKRIGVLFEEARLFYFTTANTLQDILPGLLNSSGESDTPSIGFLSPVYDTFIPLRVIINEGLRVNLLLTPVNTTQRVLCFAFHLGMTYPSYQWIITSNTFDEVAGIDVSFSYEGQFYNCSKEDIREMALNGTLFLNYRLTATDESAPTNYSKLSYMAYDEVFRARIYEYNSQSVQLGRSNISYSVWTTYFYDSLWAWSVVLDRLTKREPSLDLTNFQYGNSTLTDMILEEFYKLDFNGVSGRIKFHRHSGFVIRVVSISQIINSTSNLVALYDGSSLNKIGALEQIPDRFEDQPVFYDPALLAVFLTITLVQIAVLIALHALTMKYRAYYSVKASSPKLNQLMYIGCYLFAFAMILYILVSGYHIDLFDNNTTSALCNLLWGWLLPISFTLTFGTVAARTFRLYRIFTHYLNPGPFIGDYYLMAFVLILLFVDIISGIFFVAIYPQRAEIIEYPYLDGIMKYNITRRQCISSNIYLSATLIFAYKIVLMLIVVLLAFLTRNIQNQSFTTKTLRNLVYLFSLDMLLGFTFFYLFGFASPISAASFSSLVTSFNIMLFLFITLVCLPPLVPKLREEFRKYFPYDEKLSNNATDSSFVLPKEGTSRFYI